MKKILLILFICISFTKCKNNDSTDFDSLKIKNISEIIETVISHGNLKVLKNGTDSKMFCDELVKLNIYVSKNNKETMPIRPLPGPAAFRDISIQNLLLVKIDNQLFFSSSDSLFLLQQNRNLKTFKIENRIAEKINSTSIKSEVNKHITGKSFDYYLMTIPVFSQNYNSAYLEINNYCNGMCGGGKSIFIKKINRKWKIIAEWENWSS